MYGKIVDLKVYNALDRQIGEWFENQNWGFFLGQRYDKKDLWVDNVNKYIQTGSAINNRVSNVIDPETTREINTVRICYGYGIVFSINVLAPIGTSDDMLKQKAIGHFKQYMPTLEQVNDVENMIADKRAWVEVEHELT